MGVPSMGHRSSRRLALLALSMMLALPPGGDAQPGRARDQSSRINVLLITVDSFRPDHVGAYGYPKPTTPTLDRLARRGLLFRSAINQAAWTSPALVSLLTGLYPSTHGVDGRAKSVDPVVVTPLTRLRDAGYAVPALSYLVALPEFESLGFEPTAEKDLGRWLGQHRDKSFFAWIHLEGPHLPLNPPPPYDRMFTPNGRALSEDVLARLEPFRVNPVNRKGEVPVNPADRGAVVALYDGKVRRTDDEIARMLDTLDRLSLTDTTLVIVSADHGDELLDHGFIGHASTSLAGTLFDELIHVPLIMAYPPRLPQGRVITTQVEGIDVFPTILDFLGIAPPPVMEGRSLLPLIRRARQPFPERAFSETTTCGRSCPEGQEEGRLQSVRTPAWKLVRTQDTRGERFELYHLAVDPREQTDVRAKNPQTFARLRTALFQWVALNQVKADEIGALARLAASRVSPTAAAVTSRPRILRPREGRAVSRTTEGGRVVIEWDGAPTDRYVLEYEVGTGKYHLQGDFTVLGPRKEFGPLGVEVWSQLPFYNPFRVRVRSARCSKASCWSEWVTFRIGGLDAPA